MPKEVVGHDLTILPNEDPPIAVKRHHNLFAILSSILWPTQLGSHQQTEKEREKKNVIIFYWDKEQQSKAQNSDSKYRQMAPVGFDT